MSKLAIGVEASDEDADRLVLAAAREGHQAGLTGRLVPHAWGKIGKAIAESLESDGLIVFEEMVHGPRRC